MPQAPQVLAAEEFLISGTSLSVSLCFFRYPHILEMAATHGFSETLGPDMLEFTLSNFKKVINALQQMLHNTSQSLHNTPN